MNAFIVEFEAPARLVLSALLDSLPSALAVTALVWVALGLARRINAPTRYLIWWATLLVVSGLPLVSLVKQDSGAVKAPEAVTASSDALSKSPGSVDPGMTTDRPLMAGGLAGSSPTKMPMMSSTSADAGKSMRDTGRRNETGNLNKRAGAVLGHLHVGSLSVWLAAIWLAGSAFGGARLILACCTLHRLKSNTGSLPAEWRASIEGWVNSCRPRRGIVVRTSSSIAAPVAAGLGKPCILLPLRLLDGIRRDDLERVVRHELAHLERWDDWANLLQQVLTAALWLHPVVWWIGDRLDLEREVASDDRVLAALDSANDYALCLATLAEQSRGPRSPLLAPGAWLGSSRLKCRIDRLLDRDRNRAPRASRPALSFAALALTTGGWLVAQMPLWIGLAADAPKPAPQQPKASSSAYTSTGAAAGPAVSGQSPRPASSGITNGAAAAGPRAVTSSMSPEESRRVQIELFEAEIQLVEQQLASMRKRRENGAVSPDDLIQLERQRIGLKRQLAALQGQQRRDLLDSDLKPAPGSPPHSAPAEAGARERELEQEKRLEEARQKRFAALLPIAREDKDPNVRLAAVQAIGGLKLNDSVPELLSIAAQDPQDKVRYAARAALVTWPLDETKVNGLLRLYDEAADREARLQVIGLLVENLKRGNAWLQITHPAAVPRLKEFAIAAADTDIQLRAVDALARVEGDKGLRALIEVFDRSTDAKIHQLCIAKLGERQSRLAADKLLQAARTDPDPTTRQAAVQALSRISAQVE